MLFADLLSIHLVTFLMFFILVKYGDCLTPFKCHGKGEQPPAIDLSLSELLPWSLVLRGAGSLAVTVPP